MAKQLLIRGGTTLEHTTTNGGFTGAEREITVDTDKDTIVVHDGSTVGGHPLAKVADTYTQTVIDATTTRLDGELAILNNKDVVANTANFTASGHTKLPKAYIETNTPYTMIDPSTDAINVGGRLVEVVGEDEGSDFYTTPNNFTIGNSFTISNNQLVNSGTSFGSYTTLNLSSSGAYKIATLDNSLKIEAYKVSTSSWIILTLGYDISIITEYEINSIRFSGGSGTSINNISVKEIQPIVLPNAPFDTDTSHTTTTYSATQAVSKGDFVVAEKKELVTNGTFDTDTGWTKGTGWTIAGGVATYTGTGYVGISQDAGTVIGEEYVLTITVSGSNNNGLVLPDSSSVGNGTHTVTYTATGSTVGVATGFDGTRWNGSIDNISVTPYHDIVQATRDSVDMYDVDLPTSGDITTEYGKIYKYNGGGANGQVGHYYRYNNANTTTSDISGFSFDSNPSYWDESLGTASTMSLANPYFQNVSTDENGNTKQLAVTRDDVWMHLVTKDTYTYSKHSFKGIYQFSENVIADEVMEMYCGSPISPNLYEITIDGTDYYAVFGGMSTRLNAGAFHPSYNIMGTKSTTTSANNQEAKWYSTDREPISIYNMFLDVQVGGIGFMRDGGNSGNIGAPILQIGRPDKALYDKAYNNQVTLRTPLAFTPSKSDMLEETATNYANGQIDGVEGLVEMVSIATEVLGTTTTSLMTLTMTSTQGMAIGDIVYHEKADGSFYKLKVSTYAPDPTSVVCVLADGSGDTWTRTLGNINVATTKSNIKYSGEIPHTDLIGNPSNYPSMITDTLASGKSVYLNPLLVGQDGNSMVPSDIADYSAGRFYINLSKKWTSISNAVRYTGSAYESETMGVSETGDADSTTGWYRNITNRVSVTDAQVDRTTDNMTLFQYTAKTKSTIKRNDIEIVQVLPKVFASNSHSIYKGGNAVYSAGMGVSTGDAFESKALENTYKLENIVYPANYDRSKTLHSVNGADSTTGVVGDNYYVNTGTNEGWLLKCNNAIAVALDNYVLDPSSSTGLNGSYYSFIGYQGYAPTHNTIALDSSGDKAVKYFLALGKDSDNNAYAMVASKEMVWDNALDSYSEATVTDSIISVAYTSGTIYSSTTSTIAKYIVFECIEDGSYILNNQLFDGEFLTDFNGARLFKLWDGNGFGDSEEFEQLIDGTDTDDNGNIVKTDISYIPLNYKMEN